LPIPANQKHQVRVIALTGCDGSGKSTLAGHLVVELAKKAPTQLFYLGQSSGRIGEWISELPVIGAPLGRFLNRKAKGVHGHDKSAPPGTVTALVIYLLSRWRTFKFRRMLALCDSGVTVVTDRYPQDELPGFRFDGPHLAKTTGGNWLVRRLRAHEEALYHWMAASLPILVVRLNIDAETAHARKPDHDIEALREKIAAWPHLTFNGAHILDLDAREPASVILDKTLAAAHAAIPRPQA
jgi:energy-coupling factor transporter ATP-binding protein EcfA2